MSDDLLLKLLQAGLLEALGDDDQRRVRAAAAAGNVAAWLQEEGRPHLPAAFLGAIDEDSSEGAALDYANEQLVNEWPTVRNVFAEQPTDLLRAIVLQGVVDAIGEDSELLRAVWYLLRSASEMGISSGRWVPVVEDLAANVNRQVSDDLQELWAASAPFPTLKMPAVPVSETGSLAVPSTSELHNALEPYVANLAGSHNLVSAQLGEHVPALLDEIIAVLEVLLEGSAGSDAAALKKFATSLGSDLRELVQAHWRVAESVRLREQLLWWRLASHSHLLNRRYDEIESPALCGVVAATDLHHLSPSAAPIAVEHLLADVVATATAPDTTVSLTELADAWAELDSGALQSSQSGSVLIDAIRMHSEVGLPSAFPKQLGATQASVLVFRDLQAARLVDTDPPEQSGS